jgi:sulfatase modifying factor 1
MALVDDSFCVDRWEATIVVRRGATEEPHPPFEPVDGVSTGYRAVTAPGVAPQGYVSGNQAQAACRASGKRLCTAREWERACRGPARTAYPYGDRRVASACNDDVRPLHPVVEAARQLGVPADQTWTTGMNLALVNQLPGGLALTGSRDQCTTPEGVVDMVGNLHEWIADPDGTFRGGFYMDTTQNGEGCAYQTTAHDVDYHDYSTGFRCCSHADDIE